MRTSEAEDEVLTALSMADDLGKKVDMILNKLQKLDNIEARLDNLHKSIASLEESFAFLEKDVQNLKDKTEKTRTKVDELEKSVEFREVDISDMQKDLKKVQHEAEELKMQLLYQEHYSRSFSFFLPIFMWANMEIFSVVIFIVLCSALCHLVHPFNTIGLRLFVCLCWLQFVKLTC